MTKDELKKEAEECMHNALFWLKLPISKENVEQGGSYILKLLEPREKRIADLEKENAELKERNAELKGMYAHSAREAGTYKQFLELKEKENAELKEKKGCKTCTKFDEIKLTKAKELLKQFLEHYKAKTIYVENISSLLEEAEQFISEVEK